MNINMRKPLRPKIGVFRFSLVGLILSLLLTNSAIQIFLFAGTAHAASALSHVNLWWYENGEQQEWLNIQPGEQVTINRDVGSEIRIRILQAFDPYQSVTFYTTEQASKRFNLVAEDFFSVFSLATGQRRS